MLDDDCVADPGWIEALDRAVRRRSRRWRWSADASYRSRRAGDRAFAVASRTVPPSGASSSGSRLPWKVGSGNNFAVRREWFERIGGCDERLGTRHAWPGRDSTWTSSTGVLRAGGRGCLRAGRGGPPRARHPPGPAGTALALRLRHGCRVRDSAARSATSSAVRDAGRMGGSCAMRVLASGLLGGRWAAIHEEALVLARARRPGGAVPGRAAAPPASVPGLTAAGSRSCRGISVVHRLPQRGRQASEPASSRVGWADEIVLLDLESDGRIGGSRACCRCARDHARPRRRSSRPSATWSPTRRRGSGSWCSIPMSGSPPGWPPSCVAVSARPGRGRGGGAADELRLRLSRPPRRCSATSRSCGCTAAPRCAGRPSPTRCPRSREDEGAAACLRGTSSTLVARPQPEHPRGDRPGASLRPAQAQAMIDAGEVFTARSDAEPRSPRKLYRHFVRRRALRDGVPGLMRAGCWWPSTSTSGPPSGTGRA